MKVNSSLLTLSAGGSSNVAVSAE